MKRSLKIVAAAVVGLALVAGAIALFLYMREDMLHEQEGDKPMKPPARVERTAAGEVVISLDPAIVQRLELGQATLTAAVWSPGFLAFGRLEADPSESYSVRAPLAGELRGPAEGRFPTLGDDVAEGAELARVAPRLSPAERADLAARLAAARADAEAAGSESAAARVALARAVTLNAEQKYVSDRALEDARLRAQAATSRIDAARGTARILEGALEPSTGTALPLRAERAGAVVDVLATPGENVDAGAPILRLARFDRLIARVDLPPGTAISARLAPARIEAIGFEDRPLDGAPLGFAGAADASSQAEAILFRVETGGLPLRPGLALTARVRAAGDPVRGVHVPASAIVRHLGRAFAYIEVGPGRFVRREVALDHPLDEGWLATAGFAQGDRVVTDGAQILLSEELKSELQIAAD